MTIADLATVIPKIGHQAKFRGGLYKTFGENMIIHMQLVQKTPSQKPPNAANENSKDAGNMPRIGGLLKPVVMKSVKVVVDKTVGVPIVSELVATAASATYDIAVPKVTEVVKDKIKSNKTSKGVMKGNAAFQSVCHNHLATEKSKIDVKQNGTCEKTEETPRATEKVEKQNVLTDDERTDTVEVIPGPLNPDMKLKFVKPTYPIL